MRNLIFLGLFTIAFFIDVFTDLKADIPISHVWHEITLFTVSLIALIWQFLSIVQRDRELKVLTGNLLEAKENWQRYRETNGAKAKAVRLDIDRQLDEWQLSEGEKDIAFLLVKGLSMKEIADIRKSQERTVRQQASNIYRKAGLTGRQELSAFFLEDILSPDNH